MPVAIDGGAIAPSKYSPQIIQLKQNYTYAAEHAKVWTVARLAFAGATCLGGALYYYSINSVVKPEFWSTATYTTCIVGWGIWALALIGDINTRSHLSSVPSEIKNLKKLENLFKFRFDSNIKIKTMQLKAESFLKDLIIISQQIHASPINRTSLSWSGINLATLADNLAKKWIDYVGAPNSSALAELNQMVEQRGKAFIADYIEHLYNETTVCHVEYDRNPTIATVTKELASISKVQRVWETCSRLVLGLAITTVATGMIIHNAVSLLKGNLEKESIVRNMALTAIDWSALFLINSWRNPGLEMAARVIDVLTALPTDSNTVNTVDEASAVLAQYKEHQKLFAHLEKRLQPNLPYSLPSKIDEIEKSKNDPDQFRTHVRMLIHSQSNYNTAWLRRLRPYAGLPTYPV